MQRSKSRSHMIVSMKAGVPTAMTCSKSWCFRDASVPSVLCAHSCEYGNGYHLKRVWYDKKWHCSLYGNSSLKGSYLLDESLL